MVIGHDIEALDTQEDSLPLRILDALADVFGSHPGFRAAHAKGILCSGIFTPSPAARSISRAAHFARAVPVTVRFSDFSGVPGVLSNDPSASPHGMAIKFHVNGGETDMVGHSANAFPGANGEEFLGFLNALAKSGPGAAIPLAIETYVSLNPTALRFVQAIPPPPASYATTAYYMLNALAFVNASDATVYGRCSVTPTAGVHALDATLLASRSSDYLADELRERLVNGPASFSLMLQIAEAGDPTHDNTVAWPSQRRVEELGKIEVQNILEHGVPLQRDLSFDPTRLVDGVSLSDDPMPLLRARTYAVSYARRFGVTSPTP
jgi:catalase